MSERKAAANTAQDAARSRQRNASGGSISTTIHRCTGHVTQPQTQRAVVLVRHERRELATPEPLFIPPTGKDKQREEKRLEGRQSRRSSELSFRHSRWPAAGQPRPGWVALKRRCCERHCEFATMVSRIAGALAALTLLSLIAQRCCLACRAGPSLSSHVHNQQHRNGKVQTR